MSIVTLQLPEAKACESSRPKQCPICKGETFQRWGGTMRKVRDPHVREVVVYRYRCCTCRHTFRHYPGGIDQGQQTLRMRALAAIGWILGGECHPGTSRQGRCRDRRLVQLQAGNR